MLVTFTRRAARDMIDRAGRVSEIDLAPVTAGTFHSICRRILARYGPLIGLPSSFTVLDAEDQAQVAAIARDAVLAGLEIRPSLPKPGVIVGWASLAAESGRTLEQVVTDANPRLGDRLELLAAIADGYAERKRAMAAVDYADLLVLTARLLDEHPRVRRRLAETYRWILVDELHDTNPVQARLVEAIAGEGGNLVAVADPDQSIYSWRGADPEVVARFAAVEGTRVFPLQTNYRSTPEVVALAQETLPAGNPFGKSLRASRPPSGALPVIAHLASVQDEARFVVQRIADLITAGRAPGEIAVLYRAHHHSVDLQLALSEAGVEFEMFSGARFVESAHVKDVLAFCRLRHNPRDELAWNRALRLFDRVGESIAARTWATIGADARSAGGRRRAAPERPGVGEPGPVRRDDRACGRVAPPRGHRAAGRPLGLVPRPSAARIPQLARPRGRSRPSRRARHPLGGPRPLPRRPAARRAGGGRRGRLGPGPPGRAVERAPGEGPRVAGRVRAAGRVGLLPLGVGRERGQSRRGGASLLRGGDAGGGRALPLPADRRAAALGHRRGRGGDQLGPGIPRSRPRPVWWTSGRCADPGTRPVAGARPGDRLAPPAGARAGAPGRPPGPVRTDGGRAWGNGEFTRIEPFGPVAEAAACHDEGWRAWEEAPRRARGRARSTSPRSTARPTSPSTGEGIAAARARDPRAGPPGEHARQRASTRGAEASTRARRRRAPSGRRWCAAFLAEQDAVQAQLRALASATAPRSRRGRGPATGCCRPGTPSASTSPGAACSPGAS